jgi:hypothetical protein
LIISESLGLFGPSNNMGLPLQHVVEYF